MEQLTILAKHVHTIFHNDSNGYTVAHFVSYDDNEEDFTATGYFRDLDDDVVYKLHGNYEEHARYGMQFQVQTYDVMQPNDEESLVRYFSSSLFPGIGKQSARAIVDTLGEEAIDKIKRNPDVLLRISSLSEKRRESILKGIAEHDQMDDSVAFFTRFGVSVKSIMKFEAVYGEGAVTLIRENPYRLIEEVDGVGFKTADKLAQELEFGLDHPYRIKAAVLSCILSQCMASGDTFVSEEQIHKRMLKEFQLRISLDEYLDDLRMERLIYMEEQRIYHHTQYESEQAIASFICAFPYMEQEAADLVDMETDLHELENAMHIVYEERQKHAVYSFFKESFSIITGGPGTGKTTIVQGILSLYKQYYPMDVIALCAPTGRAAKRLGELSNANATTIHSLLKWDLESNSFLVNEKDPIQADLLIIDEFSMVDQWLFANLLRASRLVKKILIIGDEDQLPSVGCGCVLKDLISTNQFCVTRLEKIFRQSDGSDVITLAHEIHEEEIHILDHANDIAFFECLNYEVKDTILSIVSSALEKGYHVRDIQVLAPMYGGVAGINSLNNALQKLMNPPDPYKHECKMGYRVFREHDKVLQLKNQPEDEVYNGDIGEIIEIVQGIDKTIITVDFDGILVDYASEQIYNITHAYCTSIHKAQGSEYPIVIMPIVKDYSYMLSKRLLYTGITRAKKSLVLLGSRSVFEQSIRQKERHERNSTLAQRIAHLLE